METKVKYTVAGVFVLTLLTAIVLAIIWLSSGLTTQKYVYYKVFMTEAVSGLSLDAPVEFNGVNVGAVKKMIINRQNPQVVELDLRVLASTPVTKGTRAKLEMRALTGVAYLLLVDRGEDMSLLLPQPGEEIPIILTTPSFLVRLDTTLTQINDSFRQVSAAIISLLDADNLRTFKQLLHSTKGSFRQIETKTIPDANTAIINFDKLTNDLSQLSDEIKQNPGLLVRGSSNGNPGPGEK